MEAIDNKYVYDATLIRVCDGDTVVMRLRREVSAVYDFGFRFKTTTTTLIEMDAAFRLIGVNAPELHTKNANEKVWAQRAKDKVIQLLGSGTLQVHSQKPEGPLEADMYGRWLCRIKVSGGKELIDVAATLLSLGLAEAYDGKSARKPWTPKPV